jgi:hypothetical protein
MHNCAFCKNPLQPWTQWKGDDGRLYCNEFCADAGSNLDTAVTSKTSKMTQTTALPQCEAGL